MTALAPERERLTRLLRLVEREDVHLRAVRRRLLGDDCSLDAGRVSGLLSDDAGIDRLESFGAKFARMQDTVIDKLIPRIRAKASAGLCWLRSPAANRRRRNERTLSPTWAAAPGIDPGRQPASRRAVANTGAAEDVRRELHHTCHMDLIFRVRERPGTPRVLANFAGREPRDGRDGLVARLPGCPGAPGIAQSWRPIWVAKTSRRRLVRGTLLDQAHQVRPVHVAHIGEREAVRVGRTSRRVSESHCTAQRKRAYAHRRRTER